MLQLRVAEKQRRLMPVDDHIEVLDIIVGAYRTKLGELPARVTRDINVRLRISQVTNVILHEIADMLEKKAAQWENN